MKKPYIKSVSDRTALMNARCSYYHREELIKILKEAGAKK